MAAHLTVPLILTALTGIHSITTVSKVSVERGGSISVPCLYRLKYRNYVKYLCQGKDWSTCTYAVKTNEPSESGRFLISDHKQERIFTVTINNQSVHLHYFWCVMEKKDWPDDGMLFQLSVTPGRPQLSVDHQEVTGFIGEDVTINCHYTVDGESRWCRLGGSCVKEPSGSIEGTKVTINVKVPEVFTVTLSGLTTRSSGWYYCAKGDLQMPVHLTVKDRPGTSRPQLSVDHQEVTGFIGEDVTINCHYTVDGESRWCRQGGSCVKEPSGVLCGTKVTINERVPEVFSVTLSGLTTESSGWYYCAKGGLQMPVHVTVKDRPGARNEEKRRSRMIPLKLIIFLTVTASIICFYLKSQKRTNKQPPAAEDATYEAMHSAEIHATQTIHYRGLLQDEAEDEDVIYSTITVR